MELFEYSNAINLLEESLNNLLAKPIEEVTSEDIKACENLMVKIRDKEREIKNLKRKLEEKISEIKEKEKLYTLVDRKDIISLEEDELLKEEQKRIEEFENIENLEKTDELEKKINEVREKQLELKRKRDKEEVEKRKTKAIENFLESSSADFVFMYVDGETENDKYKQKIDWKENVRERRPYPRKIAELMNEFGWPRKTDETWNDPFIYYDEPDLPYPPIRHHLTYKLETRFKEYEDCSLEEKQKIKEYEAKIKEIANSESEEYDIPREVSILDKKISVTERALAKAGILLEDVRWKEKEQTISSKDIAEADKEKSLTTTEVGFFGRIINKIKAKFQGKGEK